MTKSSIIRVPYSKLDIQAELADRSLREMIPFAWDILEPGTEFLPNWHIDLLCEYLEACNSRQIKRLIINVPPRYFKSGLVNVIFPTWVWLNNPSERFISTSYAQNLSTLHSVSRRRIFESDRFQHYFGDRFRMTTDQNVKTEYENDKRGRMVATSVGGTVTGKGGNIILFDDPHNPKQAVSDVQRQVAIDYMDMTLSTRLDDKKNGVIILVMQRLHEKDLTGHLLAKGGWEHVNLPCISTRKQIITSPISKKIITRPRGHILWESREGKHELEQVKRDLGSFAFAGQYQQDPAPSDGGKLKRIWWNFYNVLPPGWNRYIIHSWDATFKGTAKSDFVAGQVWSRTSNKKYLLKSIKKKLTFTQTIKAIVALVNQYPDYIKILVEDKANGPAIIDTLQSHFDSIMPVNPDGDKESRADAVSPMIENGEVYLPCECDPTEWNATPIKDRTIEQLNAIIKPMWVDDYIDSCARFPNGEHDDDVDAMTQALRMLRSRGDEDILSRISIGNKMDNMFD